MNLCQVLCMRYMYTQYFIKILQRCISVIQTVHVTQKTCSNYCIYVVSTYTNCMHHNITFRSEKNARGTQTYKV